MSEVTVRPMTPEEFDEWQTAIADEFAAEQIAAGTWETEGAVQRALDANAQLFRGIVHASHVHPSWRR